MIGEGNELVDIVVVVFLDGLFLDIVILYGFWVLGDCVVFCWEVDISLVIYYFYFCFFWIK